MIFASSAHGRFLSLALLTLVSLVASCAKDPTEVLVTVYSDVPCDAPAAVAAGPVGELGDRPASAVSTVCNPETGTRGALVLVPRDGDSGELAVEVRIRTDQGQPDDCVAANNYQGCIVSRRILSYIAGRTVKMRIDLRNPCRDTPCSQTTTCVAQGLSKACVTAVIDPNKCASEECTDDDLVTQSGSMLDVCGEGSNPCADPETCAATSKGATCACPSGFTNPKGDAISCVDVDECAASVSPCDAHAECKNSEGGYSCKCTGSYQGDGKTCAPTECDVACGEHATCVASDEHFECRCADGFEGDGQTCTDVDECAAGTAVCASPSKCTNTLGSYECACLPGYNGSGVLCADIDECQDKTAKCDALAECTNTPGAYECACPAGYSGDGKTCTDIDECAAASPACGTGATCSNTAGSFACACPPGFAGDPLVACTCDKTVNYSIGAVASASSTYSGYDVKHINDGNATTAETPAQSWCNVWPVAFPQYVQLDFPEPRTVGRVEMYSSDNYAVMAYDIAVWDEATASWPVVTSVMGNEAVHNTLTFTPVVTSKLRLVAKTGAKNQTIYARVNELQSFCQ